MELISENQKNLFGLSTYPQNTRYFLEDRNKYLRFMNITLGTILLFIVGGLLIRFAGKIAIKLVGWVVLIGGGVYALYHFGIGPFHNNPVSIVTMEETYCEDPTEVNKCDCIVRLVKRDMERRFDDEELKELEEDRMELLYAVQRSFSHVKPQIEQCLAERGAEDELGEFTKDLIPIDNDILKKIEDLADSISEEATDKLEDLQSKKEAIDKKYDD